MKTTPIWFELRHQLLFLLRASVFTDRRAQADLPKLAKEADDEGKDRYCDGNSATCVHGWAVLHCAISCRLMACIARTAVTLKR
jgi:hypothetical protein